ncbi:hypothetical protein CRG98_018654 [Punica granatum]|uniref:Uncharacterized protein n=1 Tax=Punica granatum TaxID=22663 RepID=A0A2I0JX93_PUNGR|nr:hypothetical protein CRG98_018654 [Punica granatum]
MCRCTTDMIQLEDLSHGLEEESQDDRVGHEGELWDNHRGQYSLSLKPSLDDPGFDLILLLLGLAAGSSRFALFGIRALAPIQQQFERMNVMVDLIYDRLERRDKHIE